MTEAKSRTVPPTPAGKRWPCRHKGCPRHASRKVFNVAWGPNEGINICEAHEKHVTSRAPGCYVRDTPDACGSGECGHV